MNYGIHPIIIATLPISNLCTTIIRSFKGMFRFTWILFYLLSILYAGYWNWVKWIDKIEITNEAHKYSQCCNDEWILIDVKISHGKLNSFIFERLIGIFVQFHRMKKPFRRIGFLPSKIFAPNRIYWSIIHCGKSDASLRRNHRRRFQFSS